MTQSVFLPYLKDWLHAMQVTSCELAQNTLGFESATLPTNNPLPHSQLKGAFVPILTAEGVLQVGLFSSLDGCEQLARAFLGLTSTDPVAAEDIDDAIREASNILAGRSKSLMFRDAQTATLGLPILFTGLQPFISEANSLTQPILLGPVPCSLVILQHNR